MNAVSIINYLLDSLYNFQITGINLEFVSLIIIWGLILVSSVLPMRYTLYGLIISAPLTTMNALALENSSLCAYQILLWVSVLKLGIHLHKSKQKPELHFIPFIIYALCTIPIAFFIHDWVINLDGTPAISGFSKTQLTQWEHLLSAVLCCCLVATALQYKIISVRGTFRVLNIGLSIVISVALLQCLFSPEIITPLFRNNDRALYFFEKDRISSTFYEPSFLSAYLLPMAAINVIRLIDKPSIGPLLAVIAIALISLQNYSSSALLGIAVIAVIVFIRLGVKLKETKGTLFSAGILTIILLLFIVLVGKTGLLNEILSKFINTITGQGISGEIRLSNLATMSKVFVRHPLFGVGFGTARIESLLFTWLPEMGLIGIGLFLSPIFKMLSGLFRRGTTDAVCAAASIITAFSIYAVSVPEIYYLTFWIILGTGFALKDEAGQQADEAKNFRTCQAGHKTYLFVTHTAAGVGGGQRYVAAKSKWLQERSWNVIIIGQDQGEILLDYGNALIINLNRISCTPAYLTAKQRRRICDLVIAGIQTDEVVIESHSNMLALWGELLAEKLNARHLVYLLEENPTITCKAESSFFVELAVQKRVAGISADMLKEMYEGTPLAKDDFRQLVLRAYNSSFISDVPWKQNVRSEFTIGSIGRLEKSYMEKMANSIVDFCKENPSIDISLVMVGDSPFRNQKDNLKQILKEAENLKVIWLGYLEPVPIQLCTQFDVTIGKAGVAKDMAAMGFRVIVYAWDRDICLGVVGEDLSDPLIVGDNGEGMNLADLLKREFLRLRNSEQKKIVIPESNLDFTDHIQRIKKIENIRYFDILTVKPGLKRRLSTAYTWIFNSRYLIDAINSLWK